MDRQIQKSLNIVQETRKEGSCLSQKNEWAGAKIPDLEFKASSETQGGKRANKWKGRNNYERQGR